MYMLIETIVIVHISSYRFNVYILMINIYVVNTYIRLHVYKNHTTAVKAIGMSHIYDPYECNIVVNVLWENKFVIR